MDFSLQTNTITNTNERQKKKPQSHANKTQAQSTKIAHIAQTPARFSKKGAALLT